MQEICQIASMQLWEGLHPKGCPDNLIEFELFSRQAAEKHPQFSRKKPGASQKERVLSFWFAFKHPLGRLPK